MIRVVVFLAALAQMPSVIMADEPTAAPPARGALDSYYQKRAQARAETTASPATNAATDGVRLSTGAAPLFDAAAAVTTTAAIPRLPLMPQPPGYSYYMQRQAAQQQQQEERAKLTQYASEPQEYLEGEEVPSGPYMVDGQNTFESTPSDDESAGNYPTDGNGADGCVGDGCVQNGCVNNGRVAGGCATDCYTDPDAVRRVGGCCAAYASVPTCNVLWNELYSCRCMWTSFDYLGFWGKGMHLPPLVTTSPISTPQSVAGVLGQPTTSILYGNQRVDTDLRSGGRVTIGGWIVGDVLGIEGSYFNLNTSTSDFTATSIFSTGSLSDPILARPYFNPAPPILVPPPPHAQLPAAQAAALIAYPNFALPSGGSANLDGGIHVATASAVQSAGILVRRLVSVDLMADQRMFLVGGYRFFRLEEGLLITDHTQVIGGGIPPNSGFTHLDSFGTKNLFNGLDVGLLSDVRRGRWVFETQAKLALGDMYQTVNIDGGTTVSSAGVVTGYPGGVLTQGSNIGVYRRNQFTLIPDLNFKLGFQITPGLRATAGYNFMYVTRVARPGNEVDTIVNPPYTAGATQIVQRPTYVNNPTDFWLQGFTVGFDFRF